MVGEIPEVIGHYMSDHRIFSLQGNFLPGVVCHYGVVFLFGVVCFSGVVCVPGGVCREFFSLCGRQRGQELQGRFLPSQVISALGFSWAIPTSVGNNRRILQVRKTASGHPYVCGEHS